MLALQIGGNVACCLTPAGSCTNLGGTGARFGFSPLMKQERCNCNKIKDGWILCSTGWTSWSGLARRR